MRNRILILILFISVNCNSQDLQNISFEPALNSYLNIFINECKIRGVNPDITKISCLKFSNYFEDSILRKNCIDKEYLGVNMINTKTKKINVFINARQFYFSDSLGREIIVFHELFHALLGIKHGNNCLMHFSISKSDLIYYKNHRKEIFDKIILNK